MLEFCVKQNVFLYAMIAAGIAGVWCLFWNNRFYTRAIRDLGRLKEPKSKWTRSVLETVQQTERQPVQAETMAQAGTGAAKAKPQTAGSESAKERNELFADPEKEARISKVREGIRQTAAAESRFAGMLTPEEEKLMREIIGEYV